MWLESNVVFSVEVQGSSPLSYQWLKGGFPLPGATGSSLSLSNLPWSDDHAEFGVVVANPVASVTSAVAVLTLYAQPVPDAWNPGTDGTVRAVAVQKDGRIVVGGEFTKVAGETRVRLARLNADGTLDPTFRPACDSLVYALSLQPDGKVLVGGQFSLLDGYPCRRLGRLHPDGSFDPTFNPGADNTVRCLAVEADGRLLVGGDFTVIAGQSRSRIARFTPAGNLEESFDPGADLTVCSLAVQPDGKILVGGGFVRLGGQSHSGLGRLNRDGSPEAAFAPVADAAVLCFALQPDGKIVAGGNFRNLTGYPLNRLGRLNPDGSVDSTFSADANLPVWSLALQADGQIVVGGNFTLLAGQTRSYLARLRPDGRLDPLFNPGANNVVYGLTVQPDGKIIAGGMFGSLGGQSRLRLARVYSDVAPTESLNRVGEELAWTRGGAGPEICRANFALSTNGGASWNDLGEAVPREGAWRMSAVAWPPQASLRARGFVTGGCENSSGWFVESFLGAPLVFAPPQSLLTNAGALVVLTVEPLGSPPSSYCWQRDGVTLPEGSHFLGTRSPRLVITNAQVTDSGAYSVVLSNASGAFAPLIAQLTVADPLITSQPASQEVRLGTTAVLEVGAGGLPPLTFQWYKSGVALPGATAASLSVGPTDWPDDGGQYSVVISNSSGCVTSATAVVRVFCPPLTDSLNPAPNGSVWSLAIQGDGSILLGGDFTIVSGLQRLYLARIKPGGGLDQAFNPGVNTPSIHSLTVQPDSNILVAGAFTVLAGQPCSRLGRLDPLGLRDPSFDPSPNGTVCSVLVQADGKILVAGDFTTLAGQACPRLGRLNPDGTLDLTFSGTANGTVWSVAPQPDGRILVGGDFTQLNGVSRDRLGRFQPDGTLDPDFNPGANASVYCLRVQPDGRILVGGQFDVLAHRASSRLGRLLADGRPDLGFEARVEGWVRSLALQADGRILVGGTFTTLSGVSHRGLGRLRPDGNLDETFALESDATVLALALQGDGSLVVGGDFAALGAQLRSRMGRVTNTAPATRNLVRDGSKATWRWGRTSPVAWRAALETSTDDGLSWAGFGAGTPVPGGWEWTGIPAPSNLVLRTWAWVAGGAGNASGWLMGDLIFMPPRVQPQPAKQVAYFGSNVCLRVEAVGSAPLSYQWYKQGLLLPGAVTAALTLTNLQWSDDGTAYSVVVSNAFGSVTSSLPPLTVLGPIFPSPSMGNADGIVWCLALQPDGKTLLGGDFTMLGSSYCRYLGRLRAEGGLDTSFQPPSDLRSVLALALQPDNDLVVAGSFRHLGDQPRERLGRLHPDGSVDLSFNPAANGTIWSVLIQADGQILLGGEFTSLAGQPRSRIGRLRPDGALDGSFNPQADGTVYSLAAQPDGAVLVGGSFTTLAGQPRRGLGRLRPDGSLDPSFGPVPDGTVRCLTLQADDKILVGGSFTNLQGCPRSCLARLWPDGSVDSSFDPRPNGTVYSMGVQTDGKVVVGGGFSTLAGQARNRLGRLNADGSLDDLFALEADNTVYAVGLQQDGAVWLGGSFTLLGTFQRWYMARLNNTLPAAQSLTWQGSTVTWLRSETSPEVWRTSFEFFTNGAAAWLPLGSGHRLPGGWALDGVNLQPGARVRARGFVTGGCGGASSWFVEAQTGACVILTQPQSVLTNAGGQVVFSVEAQGTPPLTYRWLREGADLAEGARFLGTSSNVLVVSDLRSTDAGAYAVVVSDAFGSVTGLIASLTVADPLITGHPLSQTAWLGSNLVLRVAAAGTAPLRYQWFRGAAPLPWGTAADLTLTNLTWAEEGAEYRVVVSSPFGGATSAVARLSVFLAPEPKVFNAAANGTVWCLAEQADGKVLLGGDFTTLNGEPRGYLGRVNPDGSLDAAFNPGVNFPSVLALTVQTDGKVLVGGAFTNLAGQPRARLGRLNPDGSLDTAFNPNLNGVLRCTLLQPDGRILVGGDFTSLGGLGRARLGRLNSDGSLDPTFNPGADGPVYALAAQADGKTLVGGAFAMLAGQARPCLGRLNPDGSLDSSFNPVPNGTVRCLMVRPDGRILVGGDFTALGGQARGYLARVAADGSLDPGFNPGADLPSVTCFAPQTDGQVLVGGGFTRLARQPRNRLARLKADGSLDDTFDPGVSAAVYALGLQRDGRILVGGSFTNVGGQNRDRVARLSNTLPATESVVSSGSALTWLRGGASPEVWRTTFELSTNGGATWAFLGSGSRLPGGWQLSGVNVPALARVRARGLVTGGADNGSGWFVETVAGAPLLLAQPQNLLTEVGATALFLVAATGLEPMRYQWCKDGVPLAGATAASLALTNVNWSDHGHAYSVILSNSVGSVTSATALLSVALLPGSPSLWLNEVQPANLSGPADQAGHRHPWLELLNAGTEAVALDGFALATSYTNLIVWSFPPATVVSPGQFRLVWLDGPTAESAPGELHAALGCDPANGTVVLSRWVNGVPRVVDYLDYRAVPADSSYGNLPDGQPYSRQVMPLATPGTSNHDTSPPTPAEVAAQTLQNQTLVLAAAKLVACSLPSGGPALEVVAVSSSSTHGACVLLTNHTIRYSPVPGFVGTDRFGYTLRGPGGARHLRGGGDRARCQSVPAQHGGGSHLHPGRVSGHVPRRAGPGLHHRNSHQSHRPLERADQPDGGP